MRLRINLKTIDKIWLLATICQNMDNSNKEHVKHKTLIHNKQAWAHHVANVLRTPN